MKGKYDTYDWGYDKVGNRLDQVATGQTVTDYDRDPAGNLIAKGDTTFTWDQNNRLLAAATNGVQAGAYDYDGRGLRTKRTVSGVTMHSVYDQSGNLAGRA